MNTVFSSALYYPSIDIQDEHWLRSASLFWDDIRTIVPNSIRNPYSSRFAIELSDEGLLLPLRVDSNMEEIEELSDKVMDFITSPEWDLNLLQGEKGVVEENAFDKSVRLDGYLIHREKLPIMMLHHLEEGGIEKEWHDIPPDLAKFYMTLLATKLAGRLGLGLVTESSKAEKLAMTAKKNVYFGRRPKYGRHYSANGSRRYVPGELSTGLLIDLIVKGIALPNYISVKDILKFRSDHYEELSVFRKEVTKLTADLPSDIPIEALKQAVSDRYKANVLPALKSLKSSLRAQNWESGFNGFVKTSFYSTSTGSLAVYAGAPEQVAFIVGAGLTLTATAISMVNQYSKSKRENPYSYLLALEKL